MSKYPVKVTKIAKSGLPNIDLNNVPFGKHFSDHMFMADYIDGKWTNLEIKPYENLTMAPSNMTLHYGQAIFEGMKAFKSDDGEPCLFRPEMHAKRMNASASRMSMPDIPEELFVDALKKLVALDSDWIPQKTGSALYLRPLMFATDEFIGVKVSDTYKFIIFTCPVGPYYNRPVSLRVEQKYVRAADGGVGEAKAAGNYAAALLPRKLANDAGFDQVVWMDAKEFKYVQEAGTMNLCFVINGTVVTPATDGSILKGITRDSILTLFRDKGYKVEERPVSIDEVVEAHVRGELNEAFGMGTAAVVAFISNIQYKGKDYNLPPVEDMKLASWAKSTIEGIRGGSIDDSHNWIVPLKAGVLV